MTNTVAMYGDAGEEDVETLSGKYMPLDHEGVTLGQILSAVWCTHGPFWPRGLPEDLKLNYHIRTHTRQVIRAAGKKSRVFASLH